MLEMEDLIDTSDKPYWNNKNGVDKISTLADIYLHPSAKTAYYVFSEDPWLHPLRFHENLAHEWGERKGLVGKKHQIYQSIMTNICIWDVLMSHSKGGDLQLPTEFIAHTAPYLALMERKKNAKPPTDEFTKMFSHMSLEKKNQMSVFENDLQYIGSYYKSVAEQLLKSKKTKKTFLAN
jgi:hypothetical protein